MSNNTHLRMLDVPDPDGSAPLDQWAILSQHQPLVLAHGDPDVLNLWSSSKSDALLMPWSMALRCAKRLFSDGETVVLVRGNSESWQWLRLATDWQKHAEHDN